MIQEIQLQYPKCWIVSLILLFPYWTNSNLDSGHPQIHVKSVQIFPTSHLCSSKSCLLLCYITGTSSLHQPQILAANFLAKSSHLQGLGKFGKQLEFGNSSMPQTSSKHPHAKWWWNHSMTPMESPKNIHPRQLILASTHLPIIPGDPNQSGFSCWCFRNPANHQLIW